MATPRAAFIPEKVDWIVTGTASPAGPSFARFVEKMKERPIPPGRRGRYVSTASRPMKILISIRRLPENVYLATSKDLPGLIVEADARDEAIDIATAVAADLLEAEGVTSAHEIMFEFMD